MCLTFLKAFAELLDYEKKDFDGKKEFCWTNGPEYHKKR